MDLVQGAGAADHRTQAALQRRGPCRPPLLAAVQVVGGAGGGGRPGGGAVGDGALFSRPHAVLQPPASRGHRLTAPVRTGSARCQSDEVLPPCRRCRLQFAAAAC